MRYREEYDTKAARRDKHRDRVKKSTHVHGKGIANIYANVVRKRKKSFDREDKRA